MAPRAATSDPSKADDKSAKNEVKSSSRSHRSRRDFDGRRRSDDHRYSSSSRRRPRSRSRERRESSRSRARSSSRDHRNRDSRRRHSSSSRYYGHRRRHRSPSLSSGSSRSSSRSSNSSKSSPSSPHSRSRSRSESQNQNQQQQQAQQQAQQQLQLQAPQPQVVLPNLAQLPMMLRMPQMPQITKPARRVYVGGLPAVVDEARIATFFNHAMAVIEGNTYGRGGDAVVSVFMDHAKNYAFVEMRSVEEASNAMALDGIMFEGSQVRIRRPSNYNPEHAMLFGSSQPSPALRLDKVGLVYRAHADGPDRIFIGGLPYEWGDAEVRQLLEPFGALRALDIVKDSYTRKSKGYGFAVYESPASTDAACAALNQKPLEGKVLRVHRATNAGGGNPALVLLPQSPELGTRVVCLCNAVSEEMLRDDKEYGEIIEDMKEECGKYGPLVSVEIPRGDGVPGLGKVFLEYKDLVSALKARHGLQGRSFDRRTVQATYYPEDKFAAKDYSG